MNNFWKNKKILVTGGAGFIGSHLVEKLLEREPSVLITVADLNKNNIKNLEKVLDKINFVEANLNNFEDCLKICQGKDIVMNLAAKVAGIEYNRLHHWTMFRENIIPATNILQASVRARVERFLMVSSACVYPKDCTIPTPEEEGFKDEPEETQRGYGWAKRVLEIEAQFCAKEYPIKIAIARPYNAYGPRDRFDLETGHVIPALIKKVFDGEDPLVVWGSGNQTRAFIFAEDIARGLVDLIEKYPECDPVNIGTDEEIKIKDLAELIIKLSGKNPKILFDTSKPDGQPRRNSDNKKAKEKIGFEAQISLKEGLQKTIEWYIKN